MSTIPVSLELLEPGDVATYKQTIQAAFKRHDHYIWVEAKLANMSYHDRLLCMLKIDCNPGQDWCTS